MRKPPFAHFDLKRIKMIGMRMGNNAGLYLIYRDSPFKIVHICIGREVDEQCVVDYRLASCPYVSAAESGGSFAGFAFAEYCRNPLCRRRSEVFYFHRYIPHITRNQYAVALLEL